MDLSSKEWEEEAEDDAADDDDDPTACWFVQYAKRSGVMVGSQTQEHLL